MARAMVIKSNTLLEFDLIYDLTMRPRRHKAGRRNGPTFGKEEAHWITGQKSFHCYELDRLTNQNKRYLPLLTAQNLIAIRDKS